MSAIRESLGIPGFPETKYSMSKAYHLGWEITDCSPCLAELSSSPVGEENPHE